MVSKVTITIHPLLREEGLRSYLHVKKKKAVRKTGWGWAREKRGDERYRSSVFPDSNVLQIGSLYIT